MLVAKSVVGYIDLRPLPYQHHAKSNGLKLGFRVGLSFRQSQIQDDSAQNLVGFVFRSMYSKTHQSSSKLRQFVFH